MPTWIGPVVGAVVSILVNALLLAFFFGRLTQKVDGFTREIEEVKGDVEERRESDRDQWKEINNLRADMGKVKGKVGMNGA